MNSEILIPKLPSTCLDARISQIYINEGQEVSSGDVLFDVETDKVVLEVPTCEDGIIEKCNISLGEHVTSEQIAMLLRKRRPTDSPVAAKELPEVEYIQEKQDIDTIDRVVLEEVVGNSLFNKRGLICGVFGLVLGLVLGALGTAILIA
ncbi:biotin/lipoyl-containing protein [Thalassotalea mangrovi]|nr:biotin/lipoyl-containing protein [Thalassotalea mangrovi]